MVYVLLLFGFVTIDSTVIIVFFVGIVDGQPDSLIRPYMHEENAAYYDSTSWVMTWPQ